MTKVLVTGADGFIGSHLVEHLCDSGFDVRALCLYNSFNSWGWLDESTRLDEIEVIAGDVRDPAQCRDFVVGVDIVFHLASLIGVPFSYVAPATYVETNIKGTLNMCQAALDATVTRIVQVSTSEVYGTAQYVPIDEDHPLQPQSPYSATKIGADALAMSFFNAFDLPVAIARPFNTYGPRQSTRAVIPTIICQLAAGQTTIDLGDVRPTRDFSYVEDTCLGIVAVAEAAEGAGHAFNIGTGHDVSIEDLFEMIKNIMGVEADYKVDEQRIRPESSEVQRLQGDSSKLHSHTGFKNEVSLEDGLQITADWFSKPGNLSKYKTHRYAI